MIRPLIYTIFCLLESGPIKSKYICTVVFAPSLCIHNPDDIIANNNNTKV